MEVARPNAQRSTLGLQLDICTFANGFAVLVNSAPSTLMFQGETRCPQRVGEKFATWPPISAQIENCSRTSAGTRTGRPVCALIGHHKVRRSEEHWSSPLLRISVKRSNVSRVALPTHVRSTRSSPRHAGAL